MSLDTDGYKAALKTLYTATRTGALDADDALDQFLDDFVAATATFIKSAGIVYTDGLTAGANDVVGIFNGELE